MSGFQSSLRELREYELMAGVLPRRFCAWLVDSALIAILFVFAKAVLLVFGLLTLGLGLPLLWLLPLVPVTYTIILVASPASGTPGQILLGLRVRRDDDLSRPTLQQALIYGLGFWLTMALGAIWLGVALFTPRHRALHDLVSGVVVVRNRALTGAGSGWNMATGTS